MSDAITKLKQGQSLSFEESKSLFSNLMGGKYEEKQIVEILESLINDKPLKPGSFRGRKSTAPEKTLDTIREKNA